MAGLNYKYPLTDIGITAQIYRSGQLLDTVALYDDGKSDTDAHLKDGVYTGLFHPGQFIDDRMDKLRVVVHFTADKQTIPAPNAHYETGTEVKSLVEELHHLTKKMPYEAVASDLVDFNPEPHYNPKLINLNPKAGQVVERGDRGKFSVDIVHTYVNREALRASLGQGVELTVSEIEPFTKQLGARVHFEYAISKEAKGGSRDLLVQLNALDLTAPDYMGVGYFEKEASKEEPKLERNRLESSSTLHYHGHSHPHKH